MSSIWVQYEFNKKKDETINKEEKHDKKPTVKTYNKSDLIYNSKNSFYENLDIDKFNQCSFVSKKVYILFYEEFNEFSRAIYEKHKKERNKLNVHQKALEL